MHIILMGIQGSGKGTQAAKIREKYGYVHLEMGAILREVLEDPKHKHYDSVNETIPHGKMTPDATIFALIREFIEKNAGKRILIDGAIRNLSQRAFLDAITTHYAVINLDLSEQEAISRIQNRRMDPQTNEIFGSDFEGDINPDTGNKLITRVDDQDIDKIHKRFSWFRSDIVPLLESWRDDETPFYEVRADGTRERVWGDIQHIIDEYIDVSQGSKNPSSSISLLS